MPFVLLALLGIGVVAWEFSAPAALPALAAARVLSAARSALGRPYQWGATGPEAFDCSGLMTWVWRAAGIPLPRLTAAALLARCQPVRLSAIEPGDMLFYGTPGNVHHVGLYAGFGLMIHAPHGGTVVQISRITALPDLLAAGRLPL